MSTHSTSTCPLMMPWQKLKNYWRMMKPFLTGSLYHQKNVLDLFGIFTTYNIVYFQWHMLPTDRRSCDRRTTFINSCRNLHAGNRNDSFNNNQPPTKVWERHVDDVFSIIRKSNLHINSLHPKTKFTMETEENSQLPFLDTLIQRNSDMQYHFRQSLQETYTHRPIP